MYNKTIIRFGFCDILNNQGLRNRYQPRPCTRLLTLTSTLIIPDITKTSPNNAVCVIYNFQESFLHMFQLRLMGEYALLN